MYILHITTEAAPFAKVGGLGDVVTALSLEMVKKGHQIALLLPKYDCMDTSLLKNLKAESDSFLTEEAGQKYRNTIWTADYKGLKILLLETDHPLAYFSRKTIYGCKDDNDRFLYFCKAALTYLTNAQKTIDLLHLHDWPTAVIPILYREIYKSQGLNIKRTIFTIHNIDYQGRCSILNLNKIGINKETYFRDLLDPVFPGVINLMKGAIKYADALTTVSPAYEKEIKTAMGGKGLHYLLIENQHKLKGILNGIDTDYWNPEKDLFIAAHFSPNDPIQKIQEAKQKNKAALNKQLNLADSKAPLVVSITRLVPQKGPELIRHALLKTIEKGGQFVLLGNCAPDEIQKSFEEIQRLFAKNRHLAISYQYNEPLSHLIYAAADMIIIPSIFEPCGLTQMIAMHYGTVPLVRHTGGLGDTVFDVDTSKENEELRNGFTFEHPDNKGVDWALDRALDCYQNNQEKWQWIMQHGLKEDFSWEKSAAKYMKVYSGI